MSLADTEASTYSSAASPASPTAVPVSAVARLMIETYGRPLVERLAHSSPGAYFSKTSPGLQATLPGFGELPEPWKIWATALRRDYSARKSAVRAMAASGALSWATVTAGAGSQGYTIDQAKRAGQRRGHEGNEIARQAETWPTALAGDGDKSGPNQRGSRGDLTLASSALHWPTTTVADSRSSGAAAYSTESGRHTGETLPDAAQGWATPVAKDSTGPTSNHRDLVREAQTFPATPSLETPTELGELLQALDRISYPQLPKEGKSSGARKLNPAFAAWLMGWPPNFTEL